MESMEFVVCLSAAVILIAAAIVKFLRNSDNKLVVASVCLFISTFVLFLPLEERVVPNNVVLSIIRSMRVFGLGEDFFENDSTLSELPLWLGTLYVTILNLLYLLAPLLTFSIVLSIFGNFTSNIKLMLARGKRICIFSSANTRSVMIAEDIRNQDPKAVLVFFNTEEAGGTFPKNSIKFSVSINSIKPFILAFEKHLTIFMTDDDDSVNLNDTLTLIETVSGNEKLVERLRKENSKELGIDLYVFSALKKAEPILNGIDNCGIRIRRINEQQSLVYNFIYENPVLKYANEKKDVNLTVIGFGQYGEEFLKAAVWSGQHMEYKLNINVFDIRNAGRAFALHYPELADTEQLSDRDETNYKIRFYDETDVFETRFEDIPEMKETAFVLIALGDDEKNFEASVYLRECFIRMGVEPEIHTILSGVNINDKNIDITNHKKQQYNIDFILPEEIYTSEMIMNDTLEEMGKKMFKMWSGSDDLTDFYSYEFNYRSSMSASMFWRIRKNLGMSTDECEENQRLEHRRWNAYMRSLGFRYAPKRNDIAKQHHNLVPFDELDDGTKEYDYYPIRSVTE